MTNLEKSQIIACTSTILICIGGLFSMIIGLSIPSTILFSTATTLVGTPLGYKKIKQHFNRIKTDKEKNKILQNQTRRINREIPFKDRIIDQDTMNYSFEIEEAITSTQGNLSQEEKNHLNQFLALINSNYYSEIHKKIPSLTRRQVIERVLIQATCYFQEKDRYTFSDKDSSAVLKRCYFIEESIQKDITQEFKNSKLKYGGWTDYVIKKKSLTKEELKKPVLKNNSTSFEVEDLTDYTMLIASIEENQIMKEIGNPQGLDWDVFFLREVVKKITNDHNKTLEKEKIEMTNFDIARSFIFNAMYYSLINNKEEVGRKEMINTFKDWELLPYQIKSNILDSLFESENLDYQEHPYHKKPVQKIKRKIINFDERNHRA